MKLARNYTGGGFLTRNLQFEDDSIIPNVIAIQHQVQSIALGNFFSCDYEAVGVGNGGVVELGIDPGPDELAIVEVESTKQMLVEFFEGAAYSGGSVVTAINHNRNSATVYPGQIVGDPTVSDPGLLLIETVMGAQGKGSDSPFGGTGSASFALNPAHKYLLRCTSMDSDNHIFAGASLLLKAVAET